MYTWQTYIDWGAYKIQSLSVNWDNVSKLNISMEPYIIGCHIQSGSDSFAEMTILVNNAKEYCFKINSDICRMISVSCE